MHEETSCTSDRYAVAVRKNGPSLSTKATNGRMRRKQHVRLYSTFSKYWPKNFVVEHVSVKF